MYARMYVCMCWLHVCVRVCVNVIVIVCVTVYACRHVQACVQAREGTRTADEEDGGEVGDGKVLNVGFARGLRGGAVCHHGYDGADGH